MYKQILLPTDGSALSEVAINEGLQFAKAIGAKVTGLYVMVERQTESFEDFAPVSAKAPTHDEVSRQDAQKYLAVVTNKARELGVACTTQSISHASPHQAIIAAATSNRCDLIVMASHGRRGLNRILLGSQAHEVLTHSKVPALIVR